MSDLGQQLIEIVRRKAAENPDFVYQKPDGHACFYVHDGQPSCLIGHALLEAGVIDQSIECSSSRNSGTFYTLADSLVLKVDDIEARWLRYVQREQDCGAPWGIAVTRVDAQNRFFA